MRKCYILRKWQLIYVQGVSNLLAAKATKTVKERLCYKSAHASYFYELDLGQHTLFSTSNGSIDLLANDEQTPYLADNGLSLDRDETYRLFISLQEKFKHKGGE